MAHQDKVPVTEKIKEKLGVGHPHQDATPADAAASTGQSTPSSQPVAYYEAAHAHPATGVNAPGTQPTATHPPGEKVPITEKIKDKLGMGHKDETHAASAHTPEKKEGVVEKVKDALHLGGGKDKQQEQVVDPATGQRYEEKTYPTNNIQRLEPVGEPGHPAPPGTNVVGTTTGTGTTPYAATTATTGATPTY